MSIRFDICEAYAVLEWDYNVGGWLRDRPSNQRRKEATAVQLARMGFQPSCSLCYEALSEEGKYIYWQQVQRLKLPVNLEQEEEAAQYAGAA